jgi:cell division inhibitor SulA
MRAATALFSLFPGGTPVWRADERPADESVGPALASGFAELDRELPGGGWPQGQLTELLLDDAGVGELSLLAPALAQLAQAKRSVVWVLPPDGARGIEAQALPYAPALAAAGIDLMRTIFVQPATPREALWAIEQALRAQHLGAVIGWLPPAGTTDSDFKALRRLHLLAQRHSSLAFVLRATRHAQAPSPAALRLQLSSDGAALAVAVLKRRGRPLLEPVAVALRPAHWATAQVSTAEHVQPNVQPASKTSLLAARSLQALLDH